MDVVKIKNGSNSVESAVEVTDALKMAQRGAMPSFVISLDYETRRAFVSAVHSMLKENYNFIARKLRDDLRHNENFMKSWSDVSKVYPPEMLNKFKELITSKPVSFSTFNKFFGAIYVNKGKESKQIAESIADDIIEGIESGKLKSRSIDLLPAFVYTLTDWGIAWSQNINSEFEEDINTLPVSVLLLKSRSDFYLIGSARKKEEIIERILFVMYSLIFFIFPSSNTKKRDDNMSAYG